MSTLQLKDPTLFCEKALVNNQWVTAGSQKTISVENPATGDVLGSVPEFDTKDTEVAIQAASKAFASWKNTTAKQRHRLLMEWLRLIRENEDDLAKIMTLENGKPLNEARGEVRYAASFIEWFAEEAKRLYGDIIPSPVNDQRIMILKQPVGVVALLTPWNFPAAMITRKAGAALAAGCTAVIKPASQTPFSALALAKLAQRAGFPEGVLNVITAHENLKSVSRHLCTHISVKKVSFTGSTHVGKILMEQSASTLKKLSLELGGNAPFIVFEDADVEKAVEGGLAAKFRNNGQTCVCVNRFYIHESVYDEFATKFTERLRTYRVGNGLDPDVQLGPLIHKEALEKVQAHVDDAVAKGAKVLTGGQALHDNFFAPTVLVNATPDVDLHSEETFGPVAALFRFRTEEEVLQQANDSTVGLASYCYTQNLSRMWRVVEALETGMVGINSSSVSHEVAPFGGIKESGFGREGSKYGISEYVNVKYVNMSI
ncbi:hypothetical protein IWQ62_004438 [Dispira parvispora]|uniref:Succinate-semialdehyde dehydrogenase n=1 Tax=Dispira parvispora TaxID=1520584 RepID=A0A9W8ASI6_9FUNG|nr:hypothetical protein IWQ62_004438 [Dispira parvispora]